MLLFILAILLLVIYNYRGYIKNVAKTLKPRGVSVPELEQFKIKYPTYYENTVKHLNIFNDEYQKTFVMGRVGPSKINKLFSIRDDVLYNISEIRLRLPNDLDMEKSITRAYETADRRMMEYITDKVVFMSIYIRDRRVPHSMPDRTEPVMIWCCNFKMF